MIPVPSQLLISLFNRVKLRAEKSWFIAIPFEVFPISEIVLLLIVIVPVEVDPELMMAIALSLVSVIALLVATSEKSLTGVAKTRPDPPLLDIVFPDTVASRVVNMPLECK